jgi:putative inorganic carbon (HCO3(-)) transporter
VSKADVVSARPALTLFDRAPAFLRSEPAVLAAMLITLGIYYMVPNVAAKALGGLLFFALTLYRPNLHLAMVPLAAPLFYRQQALLGDRLFFPLAEVVILTGFAAWVIRDGWTLLRTRKVPSLREWLRQPAVWLAVALAVIGVLALFVVPGVEDRRVALREFRWTVAEPVLFFALMLRWLRTERDVWRMVGAWLIAAALVGREGVEQFLFGETWRMEGVGRVSSVYPSATAFGIYLGRPLALGIVLAFFLPGKWLAWRVGAALLSVVMGLGVLFSFARGAWIGVFVALVVVAVITRHRWLMSGIGAAILAGLAALPFVNVTRITSAFDFSTEDNTGVARARIWSAALRIIADHPLTGIGQDQFLRQDPSYGVPQTRFFLTSHPHNWILDFWLRLGMPGLLWMVAALAYFFHQAWQLWRAYKGTALGALALGLIAAMIDFVVHGLMDMAYFTMDNALSFWLMLGLVVMLKRGQRDQAVYP